MAYLYRLGALLLLVGALYLLLLPRSAHASFPATSDPTVCSVAPCYSYTFAPSAGYASTPFGALQKWATYSTNQTAGFTYPQTYVADSVSGNTGYYHIVYTDGRPNLYSTHPGLTTVSVAPSPAVYSCPSGATLSGTTCTCGSGYNEVGSSCVAKEVCDWAKNKSMVAFGTVVLPRSNPTLCQSGCHFDLVAGQGSVDGYYWKEQDLESSPYLGQYSVGSFTGSGAQCTGTEGQALGTGPATADAPATQTPPPAPKCQAGYIEGTATFNGVTTTICTPAIKTENTDTKTTSKDTPSGPEVTTTNDVTVCTGAGSCTTTTTTSVSVNGGTPTTSTTSTTQGKEEYCAANKGKPECGTGNGSFSGDCVAGFRAEGDPLLVAMAKEQHKRDCQVFEIPTPESIEYGTLKNKEGAQYTSTTTAISSGSFDQSNALGVGASCVTDKSISINVSGRTFAATVPLSRVCPYLGWLAYINLAAAFVLAARIVGRG